MSAPPSLRDRIGRDLKKTRPLLPPATRAVALAPVALLSVVAVPGLHFFRQDMATLGLLRSWGLSFAEAAAGLVVVALALRESVPGRSLSSRAIAFAFALGAIVPVLVFAATARSLDVGPGPDGAFSDGVACFRISAFAGVPALLAATLLVVRALPLRPALTGALYGLGCGLIADAGMRLYCDFTVIGHVLFAHGGGVAASAIAGTVIAKVGARR